LIGGKNDLKKNPNARTSAFFFRFIFRLACPRSLRCVLFGGRQAFSGSKFFRFHSAEAGVGQRARFQFAGSSAARIAALRRINLCIPSASIESNCLI